MVGRDHEDDRLVLQAAGRKATGVANAEPDGEVERARADGVEQRARRLLVHVQAQAGMPRRERLEELAEPYQAPAERPIDTSPTSPRGDRARRLDGRLRGLQGRARRLEQGHARLGQGDAPRRALEQPRAELVLEPRDRRAQGLLGDVQPLGGPREVQLLRDGDEIAELPELDIHTTGV